MAGSGGPEEADSCVKSTRSTVIFGLHHSLLPVTSCIVDSATTYIMVVKFRNIIWPPPPQLSLHRRAAPERRYTRVAPSPFLRLFGCSAHIPSYKGVKINCRDVLYLIIHMSHCCQMAQDNSI
jgi:hypothetical protein